MKVLVIGGHRGVGKQVVARARSAGHVVTVFEGDVLDAATVRQAVERQDAIISTLGPRRTSVDDLCARGTANLVEAAKAHGVRRVLQLTGAMIGHPHRRLGLVYRLIKRQVPERALNDRREQERLIIASGLEWTLFRPTRLTDGPARGQWRSSSEAMVGAFARIARADVASALVAALTDPHTIGKSFTLQY